MDNIVGICVFDVAQIIWHEVCRKGPSFVVILKKKNIYIARATRILQYFQNGWHCLCVITFLNTYFIVTFQFKFRKFSLSKLPIHTCFPKFLEIHYRLFSGRCQSTCIPKPVIPLLIVAGNNTHPRNQGSRTYFLLTKNPNLYTFFFIDRIFYIPEFRKEATQLPQNAGGGPHE